MARHGETYVQAHLFGPPPPGEPTARPRRSAATGGGRVTRDPAVALAHAEARYMAHSVKLGLARILAARSAEERAAIRALLERPRVA